MPGCLGPLQFKCGAVSKQPQACLDSKVGHSPDICQRVQLPTSVMNCRARVNAGSGPPLNLLLVQKAHLLSGPPQLLPPLNPIFKRPDLLIIVCGLYPSCLFRTAFDLVRATCLKYCVA